MILSELQNGHIAYISKINGTGAFRKRIIEMGFIEGKKIEAIKRAPMNDPAEFSIMGYNVSIRRRDAALIDISETYNPADYDVVTVKELNPVQSGKDDGETINISLVGNPNCGKTTIFNFASHSRERVANYTGVTVSAKEAMVTMLDKNIQIVDLPGTYSLASYTPEEIYVIDYLTSQQPDVVVNVIDASNLERNLFLTTQLIDMGLKVVVALNMFDELEENGDRLDHKKLGDFLGIPVIPTIGTKGKGMETLMNTIVDVHLGKSKQSRNIQINYGNDIDTAFDEIQSLLHKDKTYKLFPGISERFLALKLIEGDKFITEQLGNKESSLIIGKEALLRKQRLEKLNKKDVTTLLADARYGFISGALKETFKSGTRKRLELTQAIDSILTHRWVGLPVFFAMICFTFFCTFKIGQYPVAGIEWLLGKLTTFTGNLLPAGIAHDFINDGIIGGVGGVIVFLPSIMILFLFISLMEDTGYMARTAFLMDRAMHKIGLHGKSFIPMLMGFGCNVPAVMATRTIESKRDRILTMLVIPFMSCSARLPVYVLFISAFFPVFKGGILFLIYMIGIMAAFITAVLFNKTVFKKVESPFVMELPPYRFPTFRAVMKHMWFKSSFFLRKMGTIILLASVIIWTLGYFPRNKEISNNFELKKNLVTHQYNGQIAVSTDTRVKQSLTDAKEKQLNTLTIQQESANLEQSFISRLGKFVEPVFSPLGFDWKMTVSILTGVMAKEVVVSSMGVLYQAGDSKGSDVHVSLITKLQDQQKKSHTPLYVYFGFLLFILLYFPCIGTLAAIRKETSNIGWVVFETVYTTSIAWFLAFTVFNICRL